MLERVKNTIRRFKLFSRGERVCVGVSGGVDSTVLLSILSGLSRELAIELVVCHLDHGLRGRESERDFRFIKGLSASLGLPFEGASLARNALKGLTGDSLQQRARSVRLKFLRDCALRHKATRIALGHNLDDRAETMLMRLIKGTSLKGLSGMAPKRDPFVRPLIEVPRSDIETYARSMKIKFRSDASNKSRKYLRNRIRLDLIPELQKDFNPKVALALSRTGVALSREDDYIERATMRAFGRIARKRVKKGVSFVEIDRLGLLKLHEALRARVFLKALSELKQSSPDEGAAAYAAHVEGFLAIAVSRRPNARLSLPGGVFVVREYDSISVTTRAPESVPFVRALKVPGVTALPEAGCSLSVTVLPQRPGNLKKDFKKMHGKEGGALSKSTGQANGPVAFFDREKFRKPEVRSFTPGDTLRVLGLGGRKKIKDIFIDEKVPASERGSVPIITSEGEVLWVVGLRQSEACKVDTSTRKVVRVELTRVF